MPKKTAKKKRRKDTETVQIDKKKKKRRDMQNSVATLLKRSLKREHKKQLSSGECKGEEHHYLMTKVRTSDIV